MGTPSTSMGMAMERKKVFLVKVCSATTPSTRPMNMLPVSPRKMVAG